MKKIIIITIITILAFSVNAQILRESSPEYNTIKEFLIKRGEWEKNKPPLIAYGCLIDSLNNKPCGVYSFKQMSSNAEVYLYLKYKSGKIKVIDNYLVTNCMKEMNTFFTKNWGCLSHVDAISYMEQVLLILRQKER